MCNTVHVYIGIFNCMGHSTPNHPMWQKVVAQPTQKIPKIFVYQAVMEIAYSKNFSEICEIMMGLRFFEIPQIGSK